MTPDNPLIGQRVRHQTYTTLFDIFLLGDPLPPAVIQSSLRHAFPWNQEGPKRINGNSISCGGDGNLCDHKGPILSMHCGGAPVLRGGFSFTVAIHRPISDSKVRVGAGFPGVST